MEKRQRRGTFPQALPLPSDHPGLGFAQTLVHRRRREQRLRVPMDLAHERPAVEVLRILATAETRVHRRHEIDSVAVARSRFVYECQHLGFVEEQEHGGLEVRYESAVRKPHGAAVPQRFLFDLKGKFPESEQLTASKPIFSTELFCDEVVRLCKR